MQQPMKQQAAISKKPKMAVSPWCVDEYVLDDDEDDEEEVEDESGVLCSW